MQIHQYFCPVWVVACLFLGGFILTLAPIKETRRSPPILRAPGSDKKVYGHIFLSVACFLCLCLSPLFGCQEPCCGKYFSDEPMCNATFWDWVELISLCILSTSGFLAGALYDWIKLRKARRALYCLMTDGVADGSLRAVYELNDEYEWVIHNIRKKSDREFRRLAGRAADAKKHKPVYIAFNLY